MPRYEIIEGKRVFIDRTLKPGESSAPKSDRKPKAKVKKESADETSGPAR